MTAKDYRALAGALLRARPLPECSGAPMFGCTGPVRGWRRAVDTVADALQGDSEGTGDTARGGRFDRARFLRAAGVEDAPRMATTRTTLADDRRRGKS